MSLLQRSAIRYYARQKLQTILSIVGIALGVAVVIGIDSAGTAAYDSFVSSVQNIAGRTTHTISSGLGKLPEEYYHTLAMRYPHIASAPVIEAETSPQSAPARRMRLLGIDPFRESPFRSFTGFLGAGGGGTRTSGTGFNIALLMTSPGSIILTERTARELQLSVGDTLMLLLAGQPKTTVLAGTIAPTGSAAHFADDYVISDIATAQELTDMNGSLSRVDIILPTETLLADSVLIASMPEFRYSFQTTGARSKSLSSLSDSFLVNLRALSYLSLIVGMFLIYNTVSFAVVRRRRQLGLLSTIGMTKRNIFLTIMFETFLLGGMGAIIGGIAGVFIAQGFLQAVAQTINDMYVNVPIRSGVFPWALLVKGIILGITASLLAALPAASEAAQVQPAELLRKVSGQRKNFSKNSIIAIVLFIAGVAWIYVDTETVFAGYGALLLFIAGFAALTPFYTEIVLRFFSRILTFNRGVLLYYSSAQLLAMSKRTAIAVATLSIALAASFGVGTMVESFRSTVDTWLQRRLQADAYISAGKDISRRGPIGTLSPELISAVQAVPGVRGVHEHHAIRITYKGGTPDIGIIDTRGERSRFAFVEQPSEQEWQALEKGGKDIIISEPFARRYKLSQGDSIYLPTPFSGTISFYIIGVFYDYGSEQGLALMNREVFRTLYRDSSVSGLGVYLQENANTADVITAIRNIPSEQPFSARLTGELRAESLEVFDRTFAITSVLRLLATFIAFVGIISTLTAIHIESIKESGILRATGITPRQGRYILFYQSAMIGVLSVLAALPLGYLLAYILAEVINVRSFGWSLQFGFSVYQAILIVVTAGIASVLGGIFPARKVLQTPLPQILRAE